jgi:uncharacterized protein with GYD domain
MPITPPYKVLAISCRLAADQGTSPTKATERSLTIPMPMLIMRLSIPHREAGITQRSQIMAKYLFQANYGSEGVKGLIKDGGSVRRAEVEKGVGSLGGSVEAFYYALGETDLFAIVDMPDNVSVASISMTVGASGALSKFSTTVLITPEEIDEATKKSPAYRAPGQ